MKRIWHKMNHEKWMLLSVLGLIGIGSINVYSATYIEAAYGMGSITSFFVKHITYLVFGTIFGYWIYATWDYRAFAKKKVLFWLSAGTVLSLLFVMFFGTVVGGARRWIHLGIISVQPSEFAKLVAIFWAAACVAEQLRKNHRVQFFYLGNYKDWINRALWIPLVFAGLVERQPDFGTAVLILAFPIFIIIAGRMNLKQLFATCALAIPSLFAYAYSSPYRRIRMDSFWNAWAYKESSGYQTVQGIIAVGSGGFMGQGLGKGFSKYFYLPEAHTDFAFAVWAQETGLLGSLAVLILVSIFIYCGICISLRVKNYFGMLLGFAITALIGGQALFNILMVCGWFPVVGVPLPFISYGGSALIMNLIAVAILANIAKITKREEKNILHSS